MSKAALSVGWREIVALPDLGLPAVKAKIDTGARTTALHASQLQVEGDMVRFHPLHLGLPARKLISARIHARRAIRNTSGVPQERLIIRTHLTLGPRTLLVEVSLADRTEMAFPMILGRTALRRHRAVVHPSRSFLTRSERSPT